MTTTSAGLQKQSEQIRYSAVTFRHLLDSMARPGKINSLAYPAFLGEPPTYGTSGLDRGANLYALGALLTLLDSEVSFAVAADGRWLAPTTPVAQWLALRSGAGVVAPFEAAFALFCDGRSDGLLTELNVGDLLQPENSATALYCVENLAVASSGEPSSGELRLALAGPGIADTNYLAVEGLASAEIELVSRTRQNYPLGLDIYLIDRAGHCVGLPRTTRISVRG